MGDSYGLRFIVLRATDFDPTAVTGGTFKVTKPDDTTVEWPVSLGAQSTLSVEALYAFNADGSDLDAAGRWHAWIQWTVPGETPGPRSEVATFVVASAAAP